MSESVEITVDGEAEMAEMAAGGERNALIIGAVLLVILLGAVLYFWRRV